MAKQGAEAAGRPLGDDFYTSSITNVMVLRPGEKLSDDRVIEATGSWVVAMIHFVYEIYEYTKNEEMIPEFMHGVWDEYCDYVGKMETPAEKRFRQIHDGHCTYYPPAERRFITPEMIEGSHMVGTVDELVDQVRKAESGGLDEISLLPPMEHLRETMHDFNAVMRKL